MTKGELAFLIGFGFTSLMHGFYGIKFMHIPVIQKRRPIKDLLGLVAVATGMFFLPIVHFTARSSIAFADYSLPEGLIVMGIISFIFAAWLIWRSQVDLGRNSSMLLDLHEGHTLVITGVYRRIRHPMYAGMFLWTISQGLLLPNWFSGLSGFVAFIFLYKLRVREEEKMMIDGFGDEYRDYMMRTKRLIPGIL